MTETEVDAAFRMGERAAEYEEANGRLAYAKPDTDTDFAKWWRRWYAYKRRKFYEIAAQKGD
jgi:hypothetical protein